MTKWIFKSIIYFLLFVVLIIVSLILWGGLTNYIKVLTAIYQLPAPLRVEAFSSLNSDAQGIQGILARVDNTGKTGVWIWKNFKLQYFPSDSNTVYSFWHICDTRNLVQPSIDTNVPIEREIYTDIRLWASKVKTGQFVVIQLSARQIREIQVYDWKLYLPTELERQCKN